MILFSTAGNVCGQTLAPRLVGQWPGTGDRLARTTAVQGEYAYLAYDDLEVIDISDSARPACTGRCLLPGVAQGVAVAGTYAFVAAGSAGLQVVHVSRPEHPVLAGGIDTSGAAVGVAVAGKYAYVADFSAGLQIIDITDASAPVLAGGFDTSGVALQVAVSGNYAYVADNTAGLQVIDISQPSQPFRVGGASTPYPARCVTVAGNYALVAGLMAQDVLAFDISQPTKPVLLGSTDTGGVAWGMVVANNYLYAANGDYGLAIIKLTPELQITPGSQTWAMGGRLLRSDIECVPQEPLEVQSSTNLVDWTFLRTYASPTNPGQFADTAGPVPQKFYRLKQ